jgi:hypothetical protein
MIMNGEYKGIWKKATVAFLKVLYQYSSSKTEKDHGNP